jgi:hypothetical protein
MGNVAETYYRRGATEVAKKELEARLSMQTRFRSP